ncbi:MAG TPA: hypothetical protein VFN13_04870 [Rudaea sp.]|nr:hypothetical protein [Rudaea sp.]
MPIRQQSGRVGMIMRSRVPSLQGKQVDAFTFGRAATGKIAHMYTSIFFPRAVIAAVVLLTTASVGAVQSALLPAWVCAHPDAIFVGGFDADGMAIAQDASSGSGGSYPGNATRTIISNGTNRAFYLYVPSTYSPNHPLPLLLVLHGQSGSPATAPAAAKQVRSDWSGWADNNGFIVLAPVATGSSGSWNPPVDIPIMSDELDDTYARYNIDRNRIYLWGFSAGAHLAHALALNNTDYFAGYGVSAGGLTQYACSDNGSFSPSCAQLLGGVTRIIPVDIHLGDSDPLYTTYGSDNDPALFEAYGWLLNQTLFYTVFNGSHTYTVLQLGEIWDHLCPHAITP